MTHGPQQPYGPPPATGRLVVHTSHNPMAFLFGLTGPRVTLNGRPTNVSWGEAPFDLPPGNYQVRVVTRYLGEFGPAELPVAIYPGQLTTVYYRPPSTIGMKGSIGFAPQKTRGMSAIMVINVIVIVLAIAVVLAIALN
ncbi:hypothetical protein [Actinophytocola sp.]|uniref:hypothetical protein n=1 Tax=Actinophytocola sp. TaxID=1872138 RepID=UPI003899CAB6